MGIYTYAYIEICAHLYVYLWYFASFMHDCSVVARYPLEGLSWMVMTVLSGIGLWFDLTTRERIC